MKTLPALPRCCWFACAAAVCLASTGGCSSVIGSAYLRDAWLDAVEHAAEKAAEAKTEAAGRGPDGGDVNTAAGSASSVDGSRGPLDTETVDVGDGLPGRYATLDEAVADANRRLEQTGGLSQAARDTLATMLEGMPQQDWQVAVDEFTAALAAAVPPPAAATPRESPRAAEMPLPPMPPAEEPAPAPAPSAAADATTAAAVAEPPAAPGVVVNNACFATRVRGWGVVDRFETSRFVPGQELIVYFELDHLTSQESAEGHATRVDTSLKLVGADGRRLHEWTFEPLEEMCRSRRRDYFARYVLALPESVPAGPCRLEISVTDAVAGRTAQASLPLELQAR